MDGSYCMFVESLPDSFGNLRSLREMDLRKCQDLIMLPDSFDSLTGLQTLSSHAYLCCVAYQRNSGNLYFPTILQCTVLLTAWVVCLGGSK